MKSKLIFYFKYILYWLSIFIFFRLVFVFYHFDKTKSLNFVDVILSLVYGLKLDISVIGYLLITPTVLLIFLSLFKNNIFYYFIDFYTSIFLVVVIFIYLLDLELYDFWGFRLDDCIFEYINTPKDMLASVSTSQFIIAFFVILALYLLIKRAFYRRWIAISIKRNIKFDWISSLIFIILFPLLIIPIRGGTNIAALNTGSVYFSKKIFANHIAVNPVWNIFYTVSEKNKMIYSEKYMEDEDVKLLMNKIYPEESLSEIVISGEKPNIIIIILESFGGQVIKEINGPEGVAPNFSKLIPEGIFFQNFYSAGHLSDRGIGAVLSGYPALPKTCILHYESKSQNVPSLCKDLESVGYQSKFFYGGDINFAHIKSFLLNSGFDQIIEEDDFSKSLYLSKWGVPDEFVFNRLLKESDEATQPFFHVYFTLSSHEPYDVPMERVIQGNSKIERFHNSVYYADKCLGEFIEKAKEKDWYKNTIIVLVADHGNRLGNMTYYDKERFRIPMLWIGGALKNNGIIVNKFGNQTDIPKTLLNQLGLETSHYLFSKDLFSPDSKSFSYYSCQNGYGYVTENYYLVYDLTSKKFITQKGQFNEFDLQFGTAYLQYLLNDFAKR